MFATYALPGVAPDACVFITLTTLFGLLIGSFLNVVIHRVPKMMERDWETQCAELRNETLPDAEKFNLIVPRSRCPHCGHAITALENIPLLSYLFLRGRCRGCKASINLRYPLVELLTGLLFGLAAWHFGYTWAAVGAMLFCAVSVALTFIDFDTQLLPDGLTLPLLWTGLLFNIWANYTTSLASAVIGAMAGYLSLWLVYWGFKLFTGKEGMGYGDFKLLAAIGAWVGWEVLPLTILLSSFVGALVGISLMVIAKHGRNVPIPFGPYLAAAGIIALFWGKPMTQAYLGTLLPG